MAPLVLALLLAAADPGAGQPAASQPPSAPPKADNPAVHPNKLVCRSEDVVGTRLQTRKCMTQAQWDQQEEQTRQYFQDAADHAGTNIPSGNAMSPH